MSIIRQIPFTNLNRLVIFRHISLWSIISCIMKVWLEEFRISNVGKRFSCACFWLISKGLHISFLQYFCKNFLHMCIHFVIYWYSVGPGKGSKCMSIPFTCVRQTGICIFVTVLNFRRRSKGRWTSLVTRKAVAKGQNKWTSWSRVSYFINCFPPKRKNDLHDIGELFFFWG